ncbi:alpha/beta hydrolase [Tenuibacillus multivorans]|uniref:Lysophospholipase n=1 Tax=Tenuibacillus multivorans TaxID=237069 RepID=A0A1H0FPH5_9BACI|nr:alpha/beta hydrolase [Tenuibacillus multivorans]GEL77938.1 phospholipase [Tenuibacillus multivorans]SDN96576.1 lysophospholipase [Tenuibacillus multivorans]
MFVKLAEDPKAVIVVIHGAFEHSGRYDWVIDQLNHYGYHVVAGDLPGQGKTKGKRGHIRSFQQYIDTVQTWINQAKDYQLPVFLLGHSMGGLTAIRTVQKGNVKVDGVILSSPALGMKNGLTRPLYYASKLLNVATPSMRFPTGIKSDIATRNEGYKAHDVSDPLFLRKVSVRWYHEFEKAIVAAFKDIKHYPNVPTLLLQGEIDHLVKVEAVKTWFNELDISEKTIKIWEGFYHEILNEPEREDVVMDIVNFIEHQIDQTTR